MTRLLKPTNRFVLFMLLLWLFASALYYIDTLLTGNFSVDYQEGAGHKVVKYVVCLTFSTFMLYRSRRYGMLVVSSVILIIAGLLVMANNALAISMLVWITVGTMGGFVAVFQVWRDQADRIAAWIVYSAALVGVFSMLELTLLSAALQSYWTSTGSMRSVSTMFNPNNLGMYTGAALIFLPFIPGSRIFKILMALPIVFALVASGSRTAWVSLLLVAVAIMVFDPEAGKRAARYVRRHAISVLIAASLCAVLITLVKADGADEFDSADRGASLHTANIRVENFMTYLDSLDWTILLPDVAGIRSHLIQDNFYLVIVSAFGLIPLLLFGFFFISQHTLYTKADLHNRLWRWVFLYYIITGLSGSFLNSFPNNQLFFISLGAFFVRTVGKDSDEWVLTKTNAKAVPR